MNDTAISRDTFQDEDILNKLKHYVGVRLQQGVPLVDADWNEQEDIHKFELQAFLKWFVGNGVPKGNDGFRIEHLQDRIIITTTNNSLQISSLEVDINSSAAPILGFDEDNNFAQRMGPVPVQLSGKNRPESNNFVFSNDILKLTVNGDIVEVLLDGEIAPNVVATTIDNAIKDFNGKTIAGQLTDFDIKGGVGKGTYENAGRCLVDGYEVINESNLIYKFQILYNNSDVSEYWNVPELGPIELPQGQRTDIAYLDVWERMVDSQEDNSLINEGIGLESCFRLKREWVVRIEPGVDENNYLDRIQTVPEHVYYPIAKLKWHPNQDTQLQIEDIRRNGLAILSETLTINNGNVGIGTTDPGAKLDIDPTGADYWFRAGKGDDSGRVWITYGEQLAPKLVLSDYDDPPRIQFQQTGDLENPDAEKNPKYASWIGHTDNNSSDIGIDNGGFLVRDNRDISAQGADIVYNGDWKFLKDGIRVFNQSGDIENLSIKTVSDSPTGGRVLEVSGANYFVMGDLIPLEQDCTYIFEVTARMIKAPSDGSNNILFYGAAGYKQDGITRCNTLGENSYGRQHYYAASNDTLTETWATFVGYAKGITVENSGGKHVNAYDPGQFHADTKYFRPIVYINYQNVDGISQIASIRLYKLTNHSYRFSDVEIVNNNEAILDIRTVDEGDAVIRLFNVEDYWSIQHNNSLQSQLSFQFKQEDGDIRHCLSIATNGNVGVGTVTARNDVKLHVSNDNSDANTSFLAESIGEGNKQVSIRGEAEGLIANSTVFGIEGSAACQRSSNIIAGINGSAYGKKSIVSGIRGEADGDGSDVYGVWGTSESRGGTSYGLYGAAVGEGGASFGVYGAAEGSGFVYGIYGVAANRLDSYAGYFEGNVKIQGDLIVTGNIENSIGSIVTENSQDPLNKSLSQNIVHSPEQLSILRGKAKLDASGKAEVKTPPYFSALTTSMDATVSLTSIGEELFSSSYTWEKNYKYFTIFGKANREVAYVIFSSMVDHSA